MVGAGEEPSSKRRGRSGCLGLTDFGLFKLYTLPLHQTSFPLRVGCIQNHAVSAVLSSPSGPFWWPLLRRLHVISLRCSLGYLAFSWLVSFRLPPPALRHLEDMFSAGPLWRTPQHIAHRSDGFRADVGSPSWQEGRYGWSPTKEVMKPWRQAASGEATLCQIGDVSLCWYLNSLHSH